MGKLQRTALLIFSTFLNTSSASWAALPMKDRVCDNAVIVVGKLSNVEKRYLSVVYEKNPYKHFSYDLGSIVDARILKSDGSVGKQISVIFDSDGQKDNPLRHMLGTHQANEEGIWYLNRDWLTGHYVILPPHNPAPFSEEKEIVRILKEVGCKQ